jgi:hypothetical protein
VCVYISVYRSYEFHKPSVNEKPVVKNGTLGFSYWLMKNPPIYWVLIIIPYTNGDLMRYNGLMGFDWDIIPYNPL